MKELKSTLPICKLEAYKVRNNNTLNTSFFKLEINNPVVNVSEIVKKNASSFVDFVMPVDKVINNKNMIDYLKIEKFISDLIDIHKYSSFKLEVKKIDLILEETAKSVEIRVGSNLEKQGYAVDFKTPKTVIYLILLNNSVIIGHIDTKLQKDYILDSYRQANKEGVKYINRAEFKIKEAIKFFGINLSQHKMDLDIGASPGGWTDYMSQYGIKIVAVDNAFLDYKIISRKKKVLILVNKDDILQTNEMVKDKSLCKNVFVERINDKNIKFSNYDIIHIKTNLKHDDKNSLLEKFGKFDILTIDTNTDPLQSVAIANSLVGLLCSGASLIMTIKFTTLNFNKHISVIKAGLSKNYTSIKLKKLPHNRRELTVYGVSYSHK